MLPCPTPGPLGAPGAAPCVPGVPCLPGVFGSSTVGATAVGGSWLPPDISAVLASGGAAGG
jgi:hypothetical protein